MNEISYDFSLASFLLEVVIYLPLIFVNHKLMKNVYRRNFTCCDSSECFRCLLKNKQISKEDVNTMDKNQFVQKNGQILVPNLVLTDQPFIDNKYFEDDVKLLEGNWKVLLQECLQIIPSTDKISNKTWKNNNTPDGCWSVFHLYNQGKQVENNVKACPKTNEIINKLNSISYSKFGNVCFSIIKPNTIIPEHCGPTNARIRCHLGLKIPPPSSNCTITVGGTKRYWKEGKCLLFDDSLPHFVNYSAEFGEQRIVFMVDFWHYKLDKNICENLEQF